MSPFHYFLYITNSLLSSFTLSTNPLPRVIKRDEPKGSHTLTYFISDPSIVLQVCALILKDFIPYYTLLCSTKAFSVFNQSRRSRINISGSSSFRPCVQTPRTPRPLSSHRFSLRRLSLTVVPAVVLASLDITPNPFIALGLPR